MAIGGEHMGGKRNISEAKICYEQNDKIKRKFESTLEPTTKRNDKKTYSSGYSLVVTDPTTNPPITGLTRGERTGSRVLLYLWPYVEEEGAVDAFMGWWLKKEGGKKRQHKRRVEVGKLG